MAYEFNKTLEHKESEQEHTLTVVIAHYYKGCAATFDHPEEYSEVEYTLYNEYGVEVDKDDYYGGDDLESECYEFIRKCRDEYWEDL